MPFIPVKREWTSKPPAGTPLRTDGHWSVRGLVGVIPYNEGSGQVCINAVGNTNVLKYTPYNQQTMFDGSGGKNRFRGDAINLSWDGSNHVYVAVDGVFTDFSIINIRKASDVSFAPFWAGSADDSQKVSIDRAQGDNYITANITGQSQAYPAIDASKVSSVCVTATYGNIIRIYRDTLVTQYSNTITVPLTSIRLGNINRYISATQYDELRIADLIYNRALTPDQVRSISANPWQIYEPEVTWISTGAATATLTQYSYRFLNDDGSESTATFAGELNTAITLSPGDIRRLRILLDATGDPTGKQFQLEYRRKPSGGSFGDWTKVN